MEKVSDPDADIDDPEPRPTRVSDMEQPGTSFAATPALGIGPKTSKRPAAPIWNYFTKISPTEGKCNQCMTVLKLKTGSTTSMIRHLEGKHAVVHKKYLTDQKELEIKKAEKRVKSSPFSGLKQPTIHETFTKAEKWPNSHPKAKVITTAIGSWMAKSLHPYSLVQEDGFINLMQIVEPKYMVPSRTTFSRSIIPTLYADTRSKVETELKSYITCGVSSISISTDLWTSSANDAFLSVNAHFLDKDFKIRSFCLENIHFEEEHSGLNIANQLKTIAEQKWQIKASETLPIYCVTDNAPNMVSALSFLPEWTHVRCFAHTLQLALNDAKKEVAGMARMLSKARSIVGHYKHSASAQNRLEKLQVQLGMKPLHVIQDCETRWNSEYKMLSRLLELKQPISADLTNVSTIENLTSVEWDLAQGYTTILKPLDDATTLASSSRLPTLSSVLPMLDGIKAVMKKYVISGKKGVMFGRALEKSIKSRFPDGQYLMDKNYLLAMALDPRYKTVILEEVQKKTVIEMLHREINQNFERTKEQKSPLPAASSTVTSGAIEEQKAKEDDTYSLWENFQSRAAKSTTMSTHTLEEKMIDNQIQAYLSTPQIPLKDDPCKWWEENCQLYNILAPAAKKFLAIPATEVESERVFSSSGNVVNERRRSLKQEHISELVFLHHNL